MSIFAEEWRACLREQYKQAIREDDQVTLRTLTQVLLRDIGFTEDELAQLRVEATMRVEDVPEDFVPDLEVLQPAQTGGGDFQPHPLECQCPACVEMNMTPHDDEGQPIDEETYREMVEAGEITEDEADDDPPQQLTLF